MKIEINVTLSLSPRGQHQHKVCQVAMGPHFTKERFDDQFQQPLYSDSEESYYKKEITITNYGWFDPEPQVGLKVPRCLATKHFNDAVVAHERYNASAWHDLDQNPDPNRAIIAFLDIDTCKLIHWPKFGGDFAINSDQEGGRPPMENWDFDKDCSTIERALKSPAMSSPNSRLVVLSCHEFGNVPCLRATRTVSGVFSKLVVGQMSAHKNLTHPNDFGLPSWPVKPVTLNQRQIEDIQTCRNDSRAFLYSFQGRPRIPFPEFHKYLSPLHGKEGVHAIFQWTHYKKSQHTKNAWGGSVLAAVAPENQTQDDYYNVLMNSVFAGSPRGDNLYSVRFSEILSAGVIPVIYADGWVLPYNKDVVDWSELAVLLPQRKVNETLEALHRIPVRERCEMSRKVLAFYNNYVADSHGRLRAVLKLIDARSAQENSTTKTITNFSAAPC
jgi:hypothetical protein